MTGPAGAATAAAATPAVTARRTRWRRWLGGLAAVLVTGHLVALHLWPPGVLELDWNALAARWSRPWWRAWDVLMLLAVGGYGGVLLVNWWRAPDGRWRRERTVNAVCFALLLVAATVAGLLAVLTFSTRL
ncbi:hypothetical protein [Nakamurella aerolata]|uniref:Uncharacterized protein n=1 Tax=Nakamurella aerolata TaxID=1656892 RepID=A0A849ABU8_9ACTN|nr:hypothetical protein [Nakamurella aerolata]NNG35960.1 hypothetical protein [Nakamurella aerolata]